MTENTRSATFDVLIVGCGFMGSALARRLAEQGLRVAAWNRTSARAEALSRYGVTPLHDIDAAVKESDIVVAITATYDHVYAAIGDVTSWDGQLLVNLTSGRPDESDAFADWAAQYGVDVLDGSILNYPRQVGTAEAYFMYSGPPSAWQRAESVLTLLGPSHYIPGAQSVSSDLLQGLCAFLIPALSSFVEAATYLQRRKVPTEQLLHAAGYLAESLQRTLPEVVQALDTGDLASDQASLETFAESVEGSLAAFAAEGLNGRILRATGDALDAARAQGLGELSLYAQTTVM
ncbi:NAD(P)-dependent oxidoreductase [Mycolicibacterium sp. 018/SC-01/001]|uniref:NAD(P)-binding domain-containing protein n=1 Tax=Mycolicibacterium sp. 018/SC-01/001 TaxID=2592069 RepID=UPI001180FEDC|nr:NAD(P)-binding domain-containing protein [Mycolicibacterium sp. 018/SC-01/001]TRW80288.1 NAD(P)-dependent oxidoreductase [Mycolicibacterium sp. 018/SC-01/001]